MDESNDVTDTAQFVFIGGPPVKFCVEIVGWLS
jgi:hypothetical protein